MDYDSVLSMETDIYVPHSPLFTANTRSPHNTAGRMNLETDNIPAPRTAAAVFGGPGKIDNGDRKFEGKLFYFKSFKYNTHATAGSQMGPRFRTYRELKVHINKVSNTSTLQVINSSKKILQ